MGGEPLATVAAALGQHVIEERPGDALREVVQLLNDLGQSEDDAVQRALNEEPASVGDQRWDALLAGVAEYVAVRRGLTIPGWSLAPRCFLPRFWFVIEDIVRRPAPGLAAWAFVSTPAELANRGVFLDAASLESV